MLHPQKPASKVRALATNFCMQNTPLFVNALQIILTILKLNTDLLTEISHSPHYNVWQELQSLPRTSKMGLTGKGDKYFIRLGWEKIDCPKACLYSHHFPNYISWSNERYSLFPQTLPSLRPPVSEKNLIWFHWTASVLLALTTGILLLKCDLINGFRINSSVTGWGKSTEKGICKILYRYLKVTVTPENIPVLPMCIWQSQTPQGTADSFFPTVTRDNLQTGKLQQCILQR